MMIHNASYVELCQSFPNSLWDSTLSLLASLKPRSISRFRELGQKFRHYFDAQWEIIPASNHLFLVRQQEYETIQAYTKWFNKEGIKVPNIGDRENIQAYKHKLRSLSLTKVLATNRLHFMEDLLDVMHEFIKGEISMQSKWIMWKKVWGRSG